MAIKHLFGHLEQVYHLLSNASPLVSVVSTTPADVMLKLLIDKELFQKTQNLCLHGKSILVSRTDQRIIC